MTYQASKLRQLRSLKNLKAIKFFVTLTAVQFTCYRLLDVITLKI